MQRENVNKKYYWLKLKDSFMTSDKIDFLMSQKNGANYVVLYQMLCLKTINTGGELYRQIGEIMIPYDAEKIQRDCKYFDIDTIRVALELYKKLGLIFTQENGYLKISNFEVLVGSECDSAERVRLFRQRDEEKKALQCNTDCNKNVTQEIDIRDRYKDIDNIDRSTCFASKFNYLIDSLKRKESAPAYHFCFGMHFDLVEEILTVLVDAFETDEKYAITNGTIWDKNNWDEVINNIDCECIGKIIERLLAQSDFKDRRRYILGLITIKYKKV